jgi:hypothetical protein
MDEDPWYLERSLAYRQLMLSLGSVFARQRREGAASVLDWLTELPAWHRSLLGAYYCWLDTLGQSLYGWYAFSTSILAPEAVDGFRMLGLVKCADILAEANDYFGDKYPRDLQERLRNLPEYEKRDESFPFSDLDARFRQAVTQEIGDEGFEVMADQFVCKRLGLTDCRTEEGEIQTN